MLAKTVGCIALVLTGHFAVKYIKDGYSFGRVIPPETQLEDIPLHLGEWRGTELAADEQLREILQAKSGIDRVYRRHDGSEIFIHAVWTDDYIRVHYPAHCYRHTGWTLVKSQPIDVETPSGHEIPCRIDQFERDGKKIEVLYWFQMGDEFFLDRFGHRSVRRKVCWGKTEWPPLMKFMLERPVLGFSGHEELSDLAGRVFDGLNPT